MAHITILAVRSVNSIINGALRGETRASSRRFLRPQCHMVSRCTVHVHS